jgi:hypothetical protein
VRSPSTGHSNSPTSRGALHERPTWPSARPATPSPDWAALHVKERGQYLRRLAEFIEDNVERLAIVECLDMAMLEDEPA